MYNRILIFIAFLSSFQLHATGLETLTITTSNDLFNGEVSLNRDDYRTYGIGTSIGWTGGLFTDLYFYGLTEREENLRCDLGEFKTGIEIEFNLGPGSLLLKPYIGGNFYGDLGGQYAQNLVHRIFSLKEVSFNYPDISSSSDRTLELLTGLQGGWSLDFELYKGLFLSPEINVEFSYSVPSALSAELFLNTALHNKRMMSFDIAIGWAGVFSDYPDRVLELSLLQEEGFFISGGISTGILRYENILYPGSEFSIGSISLIFSAEQDYSENEFNAGDKTRYFIMDYSLDFFYLLKEMKILFPLELSSGVYSSSQNYQFRLLPFFDYTYGDAVNDFHSNERQIRFAQLMAGLDLAVDFSAIGIPLELFAGIGAGCRNEKFWDLGDTLDSVYSPVFQPEAGLRTGAIPIFPKSGYFSTSTRYGLSLRYGAQFIPGKNILIKIQHRLSLGLNLWLLF